MLGTKKGGPGEALGEKGKEKYAMPRPARVPILWAGGRGETARHFSTWPQVSMPDPRGGGWSGERSSPRPGTPPPSYLAKAPGL